MPNPTIATGYPKAFLEFAVTRGANRATLLERSHLCLDDLKDPEGRTSLTKYIALMQAGIELCNEPALSLLFGEAVRLQDISIVGFLGDTVNDIASGPAMMNRYARLTLDPDDAENADAIELVREGGDVWLKSGIEAYLDNPLLTESAFARTVTTVRAAWSTIPGLSRLKFPKAIRFTHKEPSYRAEYDRIFGVPLFFGSNMNALSLDEEFLKVTLPRTNPHLSKALTGRAEELLKDLESVKTTTRSKVEKLLTANLQRGATSVDVIARQLGMSRQTLFRRLKAEGVTFEKVFDELRHRMAVKYLEEKRSVNETSYLVGFSDQAAFSHAFKRWTGHSPATIRKRKA